MASLGQGDIGASLHGGWQSLPPSTCCTSLGPEAGSRGALVPLAEVRRWRVSGKQRGSFNSSLRLFL